MSSARHRIANQEVLARLVVLCAAEKSRHAQRPAASRQLMDAVEEAIADKRRQLAELALCGLAGGAAYVAGDAQLARWVEARRINR
jgi:hypothetical protein